MNIKDLEFKNEKKLSQKRINKSFSIQKRNELLANSLRISPQITPVLFDLIEMIKENLKLENDLECFIHNDFSMNAYCFENDDKPIICISSNLVNNFSSTELAFVIGHEIGHFIFGHLNFMNGGMGVDGLIANQCFEISADRVGLIASKDIDCSLRAIIKIISGLNDKFISKNLYNFVNQHNEISGEVLPLSTHPTLPTRAKALLLFSMSQSYYDWKNMNSKAPIQNCILEKSIERYLNETSLNFLEADRKRLFETFKLWYLLYKILDFDEKKQKEILKINFNMQKAQSAFNYLKNNSKEKIYKKFSQISKTITYNEKNEFIKNINSKI